MTTNRKLEIRVDFTVTNKGIHDGNQTFGGGATYTQTGSTPDMGNIVDSDGTIHIGNAADYDDSVYNRNVDLVFTLATPCTGAFSLDVAWATQYGAGMTITVPSGGSNDEMIVHKNSSNVITVEDKDDDSNTYHYKPALEILREGQNNYYIALDPSIVNRPVSR